MNEDYELLACNPKLEDEKSDEVEDKVEEAINLLKHKGYKIIKLK